MNKIKCYIKSLDERACKLQQQSTKLKQRFFNGKDVTYLYTIYLEEFKTSMFVISFYQRNESNNEIIVKKNLHQTKEHVAFVTPSE